MSPGKHKNNRDTSYYGLLTHPNIKQVTFGKYQFNPWYGNAAYFNNQCHTLLGYQYNNKLQQDPTLRKTKKLELGDVWLDDIYICEYCFKYTDNQQEITNHTIVCPYNKPKPTIGKLVYYGTDYIIREVPGFQSRLFCQNLCLFAKLFLVDKSIYYNIDYFNFYIIYGKDDSNYKPMGVFSKEVLSYDNDNNLACICIFPPYQRLHLGSLLIEFSYELAKLTPGQLISGPEYPLSPFGKISYLRYWSKKLACLLYNFTEETVTINQLSKLSGFRKEDVLYTLEYMKLLQEEDVVLLSRANLQVWCKLNNFDPSKELVLLNRDCLTI
ncbi:Histone acetyltransferase SAS2 [Spathaspora sp. JA1]|nr:Histone acetyltransferase SAS2 [Spathaspora sp. JA1]